MGLALLTCTVAMGCGGEPPGEPIRVQIAEPAEGADLAGTSVRVTLTSSGIVVGPAGQDSTVAHHHLFLDRDPTPPGQPIPAGEVGIAHLGQGQSEHTFEEVAPGEHRLIAVLADWVHVPLVPMVADTVQFTVRAP
jgi:hypothetical protein